MTIDLITILNIVTGVVTGASAILFTFKDLTEKTWDNKLYDFLTKILKALSLHVNVDKKLEIEIKNKE